MLMSVFAMALTSCGGGNNGNDEPDTVKQPSVLTQSITEGATLSAYTTTQLDLVYSGPVTLTTSSGITLNGTALTGVTINSNEVTIPLSLKEGTSYTLTIAANALTAKSDSKVSAKPFTLKFTTKGSTTSDFSLAALSDSKATKEAQNVYNFLKTNFGKKILSGVQNTKAYITDYANSIYTATGKHPAISGYDFIFLNWPAGDWYGNYNDITYLKEQWNNNGLVSLTWHWNVPSAEGVTDPAKFGFYATGKGGGNSKTTFDIRQALIEGTWQNTVIKNDIKKVAGFLKLLQDANIPVIWRPLHEAAGDYKWGAWFWWGVYGPEYTKQLWKYMYDQFTNVYGLHNLIWVWTVQTQSEGKLASDEVIANAYPGNDYVDIVGADLYFSDNNSHPAEFEALKRLTGAKKLVTLSECGNVFMPTKCISGGDPWSWFMSWCDEGFKNWNSSTIWKSVMSDGYVINREDMPSLK